MLALKTLAMAGAIGLLGFIPEGCRRVATQPQCDQILDRYVDLVARQQSDAGDLAQAKAHVREMAEADEDFRSCTTHVEQAQVDCALKAMTPESLEKCLE